MEPLRTEQEGAAINDQMVKQMELRRMRRPAPRQRPASQGATDKPRRVCSFCFQPGDHRTAAQCLGALDR